MAIFTYYWVCSLAYIGFFCLFDKWIMGNRYDEWLAALTEYELKYGLWVSFFTLGFGLLLLALCWPYLIYRLIRREWQSFKG